MRVPIPIVVALCLAVVAGTWWLWTRDRDFLTPPTEERLAEIRAEISGSAGNPGPQPENPPPPVDDPRPAPAPGLAEYLDLAREQPAKLSGLAATLEGKGETQRALLAHERVIDSSSAGPEQLAASMQAIRRLRAKVPQWNPQPESALVLILHAGTGGESAERIMPVIERLAVEMTRASSGILSVRPRVHRGSDHLHGDLAPPVAIWLTGANGDTHGTPVLSFTLDGDEDPHAVVTLTLLKILRGQMSEHASFRIPKAVATPENPFEPLFTHITRLVWKELGSRLNSGDS